MDKGNYSKDNRKNSHPAGLRGKEIGLYYRNLGKQRRLEQGGKNRKSQIRLGPSVNVPDGIIERARTHIARFKNAPITQNNCDKFEKRFKHLLSVDFDAFIEECKADYADVDLCNEKLNKQLKNMQAANAESDTYLRRFEERSTLPAMKYADDILKAINEHQVVLIVGSTGCGKTTQVPQMLLDAAIAANRGSECRIVCTQPRRISAITVAERVAYERCEKLGNSVGYQIRLESRKPRERGSIVYCTTGVVLTQLQNDPLMHGVKVLVLDEIHERSVETDMLMGILKKILPYRPDLKVILMSATVREQDFCDYFENCPMFRIEGVLFPVEVHYLEDVLQQTGYANMFRQERGKRMRRELQMQAQQYSQMIEPYLRRIRNNYDTNVLQALRSPESEGCENIEFIEHLIYYICANKPDGAILVFMPGYEKISKLHSALQNPSSVLGRHWCSSLQVYPLHSIMPTADQQAVFRRPPRGMRKVIISTIIAETSVTIDDVVYVINTGKTKMSDYDVESNIQTLEEAWVTKANAAQRKGRAGRVQAGVCYNLYTRAREETLAEVPTPEILRSRLESIILQLKMLHIAEPAEFMNTLLSVPHENAITNGINLLKRIEALDATGALTPLGTHLAKLPIEPQMGKMMLMAALFRCIDPITSAAAALSYKSPFYIPLGQEKRVDNVKHNLAASMRSDHLMMHNTMHKFRKSLDDGTTRDFCFNNFVSFSTLHQLERMKQQFTDALAGFKFLATNNSRDEHSNINSNILPLLRAIIASGLYPNMAHMRKTRQVRNRVRALHHMIIEDGKRANFHPSSVNSGEGSFDSNYFVYYQKQKSSSLYLLDATMVFPMALLIFGDGVATGTTPEKVHYISVAQTFYFKCNEETAELILELRGHLERLLLHKAMYPAPIALDSEEEQLIKAIQILLSLDEGLGEDMSSDDDDDAPDF